MGGASSKSTVRKSAGSLPHKGRPIRVAIAGAGPAGLAIAGILAREAPGRFDIEVFERDTRDRDQGSGWDMDDHARSVIRRAGLDPASISRPDPNREATMRFFTTFSESPWLVASLPKPLDRCFKPNPETNRNAMREGLLSANPSIKVTFNCGVQELKPNGGGGVTFIGAEEKELGEFDIGIDASGVVTPLRKYRVPGTDIKSWYTGIMAIGGLIEDPERDLDPEIVRRLGQGTLFVFGDNHDSSKAMLFYWQRYGCLAEDHSTTFALWLNREDMYALGEEVGVPRLNRVLTAEEQKDATGKIREWMKKQMGDKWDPMYVQCLDHMKSVFVRPVFMFDPKVLPSTDSTLPFICIGDALHAMAPFTGTGGNFALQDAGELATFLVHYSLGTETRELIPALREIESKCFNRAAEVAAGRGADTQRISIRMMNTPNFTSSWSLSKFVQGEVGWTCMKRFLYPLLLWFMCCHRCSNYGMTKKRLRESV